MATSLKPFDRNDYRVVSIGEISIDALYSFDCGDSLLNNALRKIVHEDYYRGISSTFCLVPVDDDSTIIGYFTLSNNTQFAPGSGKLDGIVFDDVAPHTAEIFFFAVDRHYNRATLGKGNGFGRYLMRYALEKLLEIYPGTTIVLLESTLAGNNFYPNIGYSYVEDYDFYYMTKKVIEAFIAQ